MIRHKPILYNRKRKKNIPNQTKIKITPEKKEISYILIEAKQENRLYNLKDSYHLYTITQLENGTTVFTNIANRPINSHEEKDQFFSEYKRNNINVPMFMTKGIAQVIDSEGNHISNMVMGG